MAFVQVNELPAKLTEVLEAFRPFYCPRFIWWKADIWCEARLGSYRITFNHELWNQVSIFVRANYDQTITVEIETEKPGWLDVRLRPDLDTCDKAWRRYFEVVVNNVTTLLSITFTELSSGQYWNELKFMSDESEKEKPIEA